MLLALSSNSPFWQGADSGYASYRTQVWYRWPTAGPTEPFGDAAGYDRATARLLATGVPLDAGQFYFDARISATHPTVEVRVADVCLLARDAVLLAALTRGLVETAAREAADGLPVPTSPSPPCARRPGVPRTTGPAASSSPPPPAGRNPPTRC